MGVRDWGRTIRGRPLGHFRVRESERRGHRACRRVLLATYFEARDILAIEPGHPIAVVGNPGEEPPTYEALTADDGRRMDESPDSDPDSKSIDESAPQNDGKSEQVKATPRAKRYAREVGVDLAAVSLDHAALAEPYAVALHALRQSSVQAGDNVAVFGGGPIGLGIAQLSQLAGAGRVFVSEPQDGRRATAGKVGAESLDPSEVSLVHEEAWETDGGVATAFEAVGVDAALNDAIRTPLKGGEVILVNVFVEPATVETNYLMMAERTITGALAYRTGPRAAEFEFASVLGIMADGRLDPEPLVTNRIDLSAVVESGFEALVAPDEQVKILVSP
jgi:hypothetical protein